MVLFSYFWLYFCGSTGPKMMRFKCKLYIKTLFWIQVPETNHEIFCVLFPNDRITFQHTFFFCFFVFVFVRLKPLHSYMYDYFSLTLGPVMMRATVLFRLLIIWNCFPRHGRQLSTRSCPGFGCAPGRRRSEVARSILQNLWNNMVAGFQEPNACCRVERAAFGKTKAGDPLQLEDVNHKEAFLKHNGFSFLSDTKAFFFFSQQSLGCSPTHVSSGRPASFAPLIPNLSQTAERKSSPTQLVRLNMSWLVYDISFVGCACEWLFFCRLIEWRPIIFAEVCEKPGVCRWSECRFTSPTQTVGANKVMQACYNCSLCHILLHAWPTFTWWGSRKAHRNRRARCNQSPWML